MSISPRKIASTTIPKKVQTMPTYLKAESMSRFVRMLLILFLISLLQPEAEVVQQKSKNEQSNPRSKYCLVFQRAMLHIAKADLNDVSRNRLDGLPRVQRQIRLLPRCNRHHHGLSHGARNSENDRNHYAGRRRRN